MLSIFVISYINVDPLLKQLPFTLFVQWKFKLTKPTQCVTSHHNVCLLFIANQLQNWFSMWFGDYCKGFPNACTIFDLNLSNVSLEKYSENADLRQGNSLSPSPPMTLSEIFE